MRRCLALLAVLLPAAAQADPRWPEYRVMIWSDQKAPGYDALHAVGVDSAKVLGIRTPQIDPAAVQKSTEEVRKSGTPYYVENLATDFYAPLSPLDAGASRPGHLADGRDAQAGAGRPHQL